MTPARNFCLNFSSPWQGKCHFSNFSPGVVGDKKSNFLTTRILARPCHALTFPPNSDLGKKRCGLLSTITRVGAVSERSEALLLEETNIENTKNVQVAMVLNQKQPSISFNSGVTLGWEYDHSSAARNSPDT